MHDHIGQPLWCLSIKTFPGLILHTYKTSNLFIIVYCRYSITAEVASNFKVLGKMTKDSLTSTEIAKLGNVSAKSSVVYYRYFFLYICYVPRKLIIDKQCVLHAECWFQGSYSPASATGMALKPTIIPCAILSLMS